MRTLLLLTCACAWAQVEIPKTGEMLDSAGNLRPVYGLAGSFTVGPPEASGVLTAACGDQLCLAKTESSLLAGGVAVDAPPGPALIAVDRDEAILYFPRTRQFARWRAGALEFVDLTVDGQVLALRTSSAVIAIAVRRDANTWIITGLGSVLDSLPSATGPLLLRHDQVLYARGDTLVLRRADASELEFDLPDLETLTAIAAEWVAARTSRATYLLRTAPGREQIFVLPEAAP